jgi:hypothetical protein
MTRSPCPGWSSLPIGILAGLAKATTWPAFAACYILYAVSEVARTRRRSAQLMLGGASVIITLAAVLAWTRHTDAVKVLNPFGSYLTSTALHVWNYGTWAQLFGRELWGNIMPFRMLPNALGYAWPALLVTVGLLNFRQRGTWLGILSAGLFLLPIALFTNLYIVHDYYLTANAIFASVAAAFLISEVAVSRPNLAWVLVVVMVAGAAGRIALDQWPLAVRDFTHHPFYIAAGQVKGNTPANSALIVLGIDWSSEIHYYAERKGVALPVWASKEQANRLRDDPDSYMGGLKTAALVDCRAVHLRYGTELDPIISQMVARWSSEGKTIAEATPGRCAVYVRASGEKE